MYQTRNTIFVVSWNEIRILLHLHMHSKLTRKMTFHILKKSWFFLWNCIGACWTWCIRYICSVDRPKKYEMSAKICTPYTVVRTDTFLAFFSNPEDSGFNFWPQCIVIFPDVISWEISICWCVLRDESSSRRHVVDFMHFLWSMVFRAWPHFTNAYAVANSNINNCSKNTERKSRTIVLLRVFWVKERKTFPFFFFLILQANKIGLDV